MNNSNVVNDFALFSALKSNIGYLCTEDLEGYSLTNKDWAEIVECTDAYLLRQLKLKAMRKYYKLFLFLRRIEFPST